MKVPGMVKKLLGLEPPKEKLRCVKHEKAVFHETARVFNYMEDDSLIRIGAHTHIRGTLLLFGHGGRITMGEYCYLGEQSFIWSAKSVEIGDRVLISNNVNIFDNQTHPVNPRLRHEQFREIITRGYPGRLDLREKPVVIKDDAWIACMCVIMPGVTIGEGAIVGAGSVVTKDVPPYTIVAGNPARVIREIPECEREKVSAKAMSL